MANPPGDYLSQVEQTLFRQIVQEAQTVEQYFISFYPVLPLHVFGQGLEHLIMGFVFKLLLDQI